MHRQQGTAYKSSRGGHEPWLLSRSPEEEAMAAAAATKDPVSKQRITAHTFPGACAAHHCQGSCDPGPTSPEESTVCLRLLQLLVSLCCFRHSPHIQIVTAVSLPLPGLSEQVSPNQLLLSPPLAWVGNRCLRVTHTYRWGQNQS